MRKAEKMKKKKMKKKKKKCEHPRVVEIRYLGDGGKQLGFCTECMKWVWAKDNQDMWKTT